LVAWLFYWGKGGSYAKQRIDVSESHGLREAYLRKGPLDADKSIAETLDGQIGNV